MSEDLLVVVGEMRLTLERVEMRKVQDHDAFLGLAVTRLDWLKLQCVLPCLLYTSDAADD